VGKLQVSRFERLSARTYSIKGPGALVDLDETVLGVLQLERQAGMESHLMQEWQTFAAREERGNVAAQFSYVLVSNPVGSGRIVVIDGWQRSNALMMQIAMTRGAPPPFVAANVGEPLDSRISTTTQPAIRIFDGNSNIPTFGTVIWEQTTAEWIPFPIVLVPDGTVVFRSGALNERLIVSVRWAEREAAPFEL